MKQLVAIKHGYNDSQMAYDAIARVFDDDVEGKSILLKPNAGRKGKANTALYERRGCKRSHQVFQGTKSRRHLCG